MKDATPSTIYLRDYRKPEFLIPEIYLTFDLHNTATLVTNEMKVQRNGGSGPLVLNGEELVLKSVFLDGKELEKQSYQVTETTLTIPETPESFDLKIINEINPEANTALDGLYKSGDIYCTQNEPEGFRRITYFIDRPDVMSKYKTKVMAPKSEFPTLLSNGNPIERGELDGGKHFVVWEDPFPKPSYLYALVAGNLGLVEDEYTTKSGRKVKLEIYCDKGNESRCGWAMESLKKSMKWDEDVYGLEYDLDIYMIVAVDSFNMGAMENKGLNIFNSKYVLADPETATDNDFMGVEGVIGHEYFHNWTGNRVTCRDWFQLTLKEGLTVFRDQEFSADMNSRPVKRIEDVLRLRSRQFQEDAGPTSHPIKPSSYIEINNFYTATIYEKGAEVIRMIHTLLGPENYRKGIDLYFERHDGQAVTTEDFVSAMEDASGYDLGRFKKWYGQAGTPEVTCEWTFSESDETFSLRVTQKTKATPGQDVKHPMHFPLKMGLVDSKGNDMTLVLDDSHQKDLSRGLLHITKDTEEFVFKNITEKPVPSLNRDFSAPINLKTSHSPEDQLFLMAFDSNNFNRYEATREMGMKILLDLINGKDEVPKNFIEGFGNIVDDPKMDDACKAYTLNLPDEGALHQRQEVLEFEKTFKARKKLLNVLGTENYDKFKSHYDRLSSEHKEFEISNEAMGKRALKNALLVLLVSSGREEASKLAYDQFKSANNLTDEYSALTVLLRTESEFAAKASKEFYDKWKDNTLVIQKWLAIEAYVNRENALDVVEKLEEDKVYDKKVPNLIRALLGAFASQNHVQFNRPDGKSYAYIAKRILEIDRINPAMASGLSMAFRNFSKLPTNLNVLMKKELEGILAVDGLSKNTYEMISKILNG